MINLKSVSHKYKDRTVLNEMNYHFEVGKSYYISGKSGCGKSTLGMILSGLLEPSEGGVTLNGKSAVMFQNPDIQFCMDTVHRELIFVLENQCVDIKIMDGLIDDVLKKVNGFHLKYRKLVTLSGGEKQRIALASAFLMDASILILDEPFASLDQSSSQELLELLNSYREQNQLTLIVIDHLHHYYDAMIDVYLKIVDGNLYEGLDDEVVETVINVSPQYFENTVLNYENVFISYNDRAIVSDASFAISSGECVALVGDSGSGKSSLLRILLNLVKYDGNVWLDKANLKKYRGKMG
ncbi:MAG: ATP-binding cassette domain-containing protein, partial [Erysipelothrix sp.]